MEGSVIGIEGPFGSGKSAYAVNIIRRITKKNKNVEVWTNIKLSNKIPGKIHFCEPLDLFDIFAQILPDAMEERKRLTQPRAADNGLLAYKREAFKKRIIVIDEAGVVINNRKFGEFDNDLTAFINQVRKYNTTIILVSADGSQVEKNLRRYVKQWISLETIPWVGWMWLPIPFAMFRMVFWHMKDEDGRILLKEKVKSDGSIIRVPQRFFKGLVRISSSWPHYDDLALNVSMDLEKRISEYNRERSAAWKIFHGEETEKKKASKSKRKG